MLLAKFACVYNLHLGIIDTVNALSLCQISDSKDVHVPDHKRLAGQLDTFIKEIS